MYKEKKQSVNELYRRWIVMYMFVIVYPHSLWTVKKLIEIAMNLFNSKKKKKSLMPGIDTSFHSRSKSGHLVATQL